MKKLRITCFALALIQLIFFFGNIFHSIQSENVDNSKEFSISFSFVLGYLITIAIVVVTVILAGKLNRSKLGWGIFSLFFPWLAGIIIAFLKEAEYKSRADYGYAGSGSYTSTFIANKSCSACGRSVSLSSAAGQRCPYCGAYWSTERRVNR